jgi:hypothetical protein
MTKDEALKLALEALKGVLDDARNVRDASISGGLYEVVQCRDAITAIKEALAQPEQEPMHPALQKMYEDYFDKCFRAMPLPEPMAQNFCSRCGKRTPDLTTIHTCTPPRGLEPL